ncbi:MAG: hypothetical protein ACRDGT_07610 [Candidatus Limnocylindria bacterium]
MPTSKSEFKDLLLDLLWSLWEELGVPGTVRRRHGDVFIDPEPLVLFTALHGRLDPRLRDESIDWVITHGEYVSKARIKNLRKSWSAEEDTSFARYAATVNAYTELGWPDDDATVLSFRPRARAVLRDLAPTPLLSLRIRAMFGVSARAELIRVFVSNPDAAFTATELAEETAYVRRQVVRALESLQLAGLIRSLRAGANTRFELARGADLAALVGPRPARSPRWQAVLLVFKEILDLLDRAAGQGELEASLSVSRFFEAHRDELDQAEIEGLRKSQRAIGKAGLAAFQHWAAQVVRSYARVG